MPGFTWEGVAALEQRLSKSTFVSSHLPSEDDIKLFWFLGTRTGGATDEKSLDGFPCVQRWYAHIKGLLEESFPGKSRSVVISAPSLDDRRGALGKRFSIIEERIQKLEREIQKLEVAPAANQTANARNPPPRPFPDTRNGAAGSAPEPEPPAIPSFTFDNEIFQGFVYDQCKAIGLTSARLIRVQGDYYNWTLEKRRETLQADSVEKLCKTIVMENTKATDEDAQLEGYSRYWLVCVQYCRKLNAEKLKHYLAAQWKDKIPKRRFNMRLVSSEVNDQLTGFKHNAVTPVGCKTALPMFLSHEIASLPYFWLGGGEVDVKLQSRTAEFIKVFKPVILDCTD